MRHRFTAALVIVAGFWLLPLAPTAGAAFPYSSPEGGYSAIFPLRPTEDVEDNPQYHTVTELADDSVTIWGTGHTIYRHDIDAKGELQANATNFAKEISGTILAQKSITFTRGPGDTLPGVEFTVDSEKLSGKGITVVDGRRTLIIVAVCRKPNSRMAEIERFLKTLKITRLKN
jgi:hypothetical protein